MPTATNPAAGPTSARREYAVRLARRVAGLACAVTLLGALACGDELGECDQVAAEELVYGRAGLVAVKGQAMLHDSCGNAVFCHSSSARGQARHGAPAGMSFDMLPEATAWPRVVELREEIWDAVEGGSMPPGRAGYDTLGDGDWAFDVERTEQAPRLPKVATEEGKAVLRNWLACGAPVVAQSQVPAWAQPTTDGGAGLTDFGDLYDQVINPSCALAGCHNASAQGKLSMASECDAYQHLLDPCDGGEARVTPGDPDSLLVDKLESDNPQCGELRMPPPPFPPLSAEVVEQVRAWLSAGAPAAACGVEP